MYALRLVIALCLLQLNITFSKASDMRPGLYEVIVKVELPHITTPVHIIRKNICYTNKQLRENMAFSILSENPLSKCEQLSICSSSNRFKFQIVCPGRKSGYAFGTFTTTPRNFSGSIRMNMGGKNMTIIERQDGKYIGPCIKHSGKN